LEREFFRLPYQPFEPVFKQLLSILKAVNRQRRKRGFAMLPVTCLRNKLRLGQVFLETPGNRLPEERALAASEAG